MSKFATPLHVSERIAQLGQRIRVARIRRGWSVLDLASKAGVNRKLMLVDDHRFMIRGDGRS